MVRSSYRVRTVLLLLVACSLLLTTSLALVVVWQGAQDSVHALIRDTMSRIRDNFRARAGNYLNEAGFVLDPVVAMAEFGILHGDSPDSITGFMKNMLSHHAQFSSFTVVTEKGVQLTVQRMPDGSLSSSLTMPAPGGRSTLWSHDRETWRQQLPDAFEPTATARDPRQDAWYRDCVERRTLVWSPIHGLPFGQGPGVTCAMPIADGAGGPIRHVVAIDIPIRDLSYFLGDQVNEGIAAFVADESGQLIAAPIARPESGAAPTTLAAGVSETLSPKTLSPESLASADHRVIWNALKSRLNESDDFFTFDVDDHELIGLRFSIRNETPWNWTIYVLADDDLFMAEARRQMKRSLVLVLIVTSAAIGLALILSHRLTHPLTVLAKDMKRVELFDLDGATSISSRIQEVSEMSHAYDRMKVGIRSFRKYVPEDLVRDLILCGEEARLGGERRALTVYFSDIADFTSHAERLTPETLVDYLSDYFTRMSDTIRAHDGTIDKYIGDAVMAFWGAPAALTNHAEPAARAALANRRLLETAAKDAQGPTDRPHFTTRIGLNTGDVIVGNMGSPHRLNYTVIGDVVNLASRLEGLNKQYGTGIIVSEATRSGLGPEFVTRKLDLVAVKGKELPVAIHELVETRDRVSDEMRSFLAAWDIALPLYEARAWKEARSAFEKALSLRDDYASHLYIERCDQFIATPPPSDWDGVYRWKSK